MSDSDLANQLHELSELHAAGELDDDEFALARQYVLGALVAPAVGGDSQRGASATAGPGIGPPSGAGPPAVPLSAQLSRLVVIRGYEMPMAVPVVAGVVLLLLLVIAIASIG